MTSAESFFLKPLMVFSLVVIMTLQPFCLSNRYRCCSLVVEMISMNHISSQTADVAISTGRRNDFTESQLFSNLWCCFSGKLFKSPLRSTLILTAEAKLISSRSIGRTWHSLTRDELFHMDYFIVIASFLQRKNIKKTLYINWFYFYQMCIAYQEIK